MERFCYLNGKLLPLAEALLPLSDRGIIYGDGLFETVRIYRGAPFLLAEHFFRLQGGAHRLELKLELKEEELLAAAGRLIAANGVREGVLRLILTRGLQAAGGLWPAETGRATLLMTAAEGIPYCEEQYRRGLHGTVVSFPRNELSPLVKLKTLNFLENILGRREAAAGGYDEGLFVNSRGELTEGTTCNLFMVSRGVFHTPPVSCGLLPGITREVVFKLAAGKGITVLESAFNSTALLHADEAFLTASLIEIMPLVSLEGRPIGSGRPGPLTRSLLESYRLLASRGMKPEG